MVATREISSYKPSSFRTSDVRFETAIPDPAVVTVSCASYKSMWISRPANFPIATARASPPMPAPLQRRFSLRYILEDYLTHQIATRNLGLVDKSDIDYGLDFTSAVAAFYTSARTSRVGPGYRTWNKNNL